MKKETNKLLPPLVGEVSANFSFSDIGCHVVSVTDPYGRIHGFLDRSRYISFLLNRIHEAEWTPFQTRYFSENLVAPIIEPWPLDL
jgi:hypothetical protein